MKKLTFKSIVIIAILTLCSCGQPAVYEHLTDEIYLIAPDLVDQVSVSYHYSGGSYSRLVNPIVTAVGYNDEFVIVKQRSGGKDTTKYYIIDVKKIKKEREKFVSKTDTIRYRSYYKGINGKDSLGPEQIQISTSKFSPKEPERLTFKEFIKKRKQMSVPDSLDFTINYEKLGGNKDLK